MKIGVFEFCIDKSVDPAVIAKRAEELGFDSYWVPEHAVIPIKTSSPYPASDDGKIPDEYGRITDPFVSLARASAVTKTIELGGVGFVVESTGNKHIETGVGALACGFHQVRPLHRAKFRTDEYPGTPVFISLEIMPFGTYEVARPGRQ